MASAQRKPDIEADDVPPKQSPFEKSRGIERRYAMALRKIGRQIGVLIDGFPNPMADPTSVPEIDAALTKYADLITPWARAVAGRVIADSNRQDLAAFRQHSRSMSRSLRIELMTAPTGETQRRLLAEQVGLIRSLPLDAAQRVHDLTLEGLTTATRASEIAKMIAASGQVAMGRATLIARTEVARTASTLTQARAIHVGSEGYVWRTARDSDVRPSHGKMEGRFVSWATPPTLDAMVGHAGCFPNCRCYPEPIIPD